MSSQVIRLLRGGDIITTGRITTGNDGHPFTYQRTDEVGVYRFEWADYFTKDTETVTITLGSANCTATKADSTNSATVTVSSPSKARDAYVRITVAITDGETFVMKLNIRGEAVE